jgi:CheY-like chemotaxis protein
VGPSTESTPDPTDRTAVSVLVIDDDRDTRELISQILERAGYTAVTAADGREALARLRSFRPAVIMLDVCMPVMDGAEFREVQRRDRDLLGIPTVVMTAAGKAVEPMLDLAVEQTLRKPIHIRDLLAIVERHCPKPVPGA